MKKLFLLLGLLVATSAHAQLTYSNSALGITVYGNATGLTNLPATALADGFTGTGAFVRSNAPTMFNATNTGNLTVSGTLTATNGVVLPSVLINLTADDQVVGASTNATIRLQSTSVTAADRTFVLTTGVPDKIITLIWVDGGDAGELLDDSDAGAGYVFLSAAWRPQRYDTLRLIGVGTDWYELSRSDNYTP